jgi:hypothetical protein
MGCLQTSQAYEKLIKPLKTIKNLENELQKEVNKGDNYCHEWCLTINIAKTQYLQQVANENRTKKNIQ